MSLFGYAFDLVNLGKKTIEVRLNDEKRRRLLVDDIITFTNLDRKNETLKVKILELFPFPSFRDMYKNISFEDIGRAGWSMDKMIKETYKIYTKEAEEKYGTLAIRINKIDV
jgi:ASC-1-like (ASCH) protein